jgi:outer membrane lipoprotein-sorting protein
MHFRNAAKPKFFLTLFSVLFICQAVAVKADDQLSPVLDGILKRYGAFKGLTVNYKRESITKSMAMLGSAARAETATGKILFSPPGYLAIRQATPGSETITTDGETIWYFIPAKNTVYEYPADKWGKEVRLLSEIFSGLSKAGDSFDVTQPDPGDNKEYHLKLVPDPPWEEVEHIDLLVDRSRFNIRVVEIHDLLGDVTRFTLGELLIRKDLKKEDFIFKAPAGVKVNKE